MKINEFKLSLFWAETNLALLEKESPAAAPLAHLGRYASYVRAFDDAQYKLRAEKIVLKPAPPWGRTKGEHFWTYYTGGKSNAQVGGNLAWRRLIPFRAPLPLTVELTPPLSEMMLDAFFYPHGIAFLATLCWQQQEIALQEAAAQAFDLRYRRRYRLRWQPEDDPLFADVEWPGTVEGEFSLNQLSAHALATTHRAALGPNVRRGELTAPQPDPFTVVTLLEGAEVDLGRPPQAHDAVLAALHALASGQPLRPGAGVPPLETASVGLGRDAGQADLLYGERRSRVIWYPSRFTTTDPSSRFSLDCYHSNLTLVSIQTESLCGLVEAVAVRLDQGPALSSHQRELARYASNTLGLLYSANRDIYRSFSPRRQIEQNGWKESVNRIRRYYNNPDLH